MIKNFTRDPRSAAVLGVLLACLAGCGGEQASQQVTGTVTLPDGTPVTSGTIMFESSELQLSAFGEIAEDGTYRLSTHSVDDGAPVGSYVVTIQGAMQPDTRSYEEQTEGVGTPPQPLIHSKYTAAATSDLKAEVTSGKNVLDFVVDPPQ